MAIINPIELAKKVEGSYMRYLETSFYFRNPELRRSFKDALTSGRLIKGPYLEGTPVYKQGKNFKEVAKEILRFLPDEGFLRALEGKRPLYQHQEEAIRKKAAGRNVVVTTGTGSGKTESFLYPILLHLYREYKEGTLGSGVRALILYPMNALANDQRERLGDISAKLQQYNSGFNFTFGQYIGETPKDENDNDRNAEDHLRNRFPGELVLRSEMRETPPHILLTNYSMLEYLLIRPLDSRLFDNGMAKWWTYIVLDEAHQYRGAKGIEMGMLLRRLKQRLREGGRTEPFISVATSATLTNAEGEKGVVAQFASELFGEPFEEESVIFGVTEEVLPGESFNLQVEDYEKLLSSINTGSKDLLRNYGAFYDEVKDENVKKIAGNILKNDRRTTQLRQMATEQIMDFMEIGGRIFPDLVRDSRIDALSLLVELLMKAEDPVTGNPLLSARYHFFIRSLEGAYLSLYPENKVSLDRSGNPGEGRFFETALCRECGQHYLVGQIWENRLEEAIRDPGDSGYGTVFFRPLSIEEIKEMGVIGTEEDGTEDFGDEDEGLRAPKNIYRLCVICGYLELIEPGEVEKVRPVMPCGHQNHIYLEKQKPLEDRPDQTPQCSSCQYGGQDPVREVTHGTDGPHVVIATELYKRISNRLPAEYRKILAFADSRQEAAFFAWYLDNSYQEILSRNLMYETISELSVYSTQGLSLKEIGDGMEALYEERSLFPPSMGRLDRRKKLWLYLYREFLTDEKRISLEGVGLIKWSLIWPDGFTIPKALYNPPWNLSEEKAENLFFILLDFLRTDKAVELKAGPGVRFSWHDLSLQANQKSVVYSEAGYLRGRQRRNLRLWNGLQGRRAQFLIKLLMSKGFGKDEARGETKKILAVIWDAIRSIGSEDSYKICCYSGDGCRLNPDWWRAYALRPDDSVYICYTCGRIQAVSVSGICARHRCPGKVSLVKVKDLEPDHYNLLYRTDLPGFMRVEEHTAQINHKKGRQFQRDFKSGRIHVLSCSTTFELGVDLGDLNIVFLRNVPPESFNYTQRVGRAGRRSGIPGFALTYCRKSPHDFYHFNEPQRMLQGKIRAPVLRISNEKIIVRHIAATVFSYYFRSKRERFGSLKDFINEFTNPSAVADFKNYLLARRAQYEEVLKEIIPKEMWARIGLGDETWIQKIAGEESRLRLAELEVAADFQSLILIEQKSVERKKYKKAKWAIDRQETISSESILTFLSRKAIIPKYGFPVDVVELDTHGIQKTAESHPVTLARDLSQAVSEFAPTSRLVANKKEWVSYAIKQVPEREWERWHYCIEHNIFIKKEREEHGLEKCCERMREFIIPRFGFVTNHENVQEPKGRPSRLFSSRPHFVGLKGTEPEELDFGAVVIAKAAMGQMVVICEGRKGKQFYICTSCGAGFCFRQHPHDDPFGEKCRGKLDPVSLGHEFITDVLGLRFTLPTAKTAIEPTDQYWFTYSLGTALVEGASEVLEIPSTDLNVTIKKYDTANDTYQIILYDAVPGGAGLVARLEQKDILLEAIKAGYNRVDGKCGCGEDTSCYGCLRSYRNQFAHQKMQRGPVKEYLTVVLAAMEEA